MPTELPLAGQGLSALPELPEAMPMAGISGPARQSLRQLLADADRRLARHLYEGVAASALLSWRARLVDRVVVHVARACLGVNLTAPGSDFALFAVGGYGHLVLFPHSDIDLLALCLAEPDEPLARGLEEFFSCLWDIGLKPGQAVRTMDECRQLAAEEVAVFTSLLDARLLYGDAGMQAQLARLIDDPAIWPALEFLAAKRAEQARRHARFDDTAHNLEPNIKESPGGLRTLDLLRWLGKRVIGAPDLGGLVHEGLLDPAELDRLEQAQGTLQRYRYALHLEAGRAEERLLFDYQRPLAEKLGFRDHQEAGAESEPWQPGQAEPLLGVEQFMQGYYRAATLVERLGVQLTERFDELLEPDPKREIIDADFLRCGKRLERREPDLFLDDPAALVRAFIVRIDHPELIGFTAETMRRIQQALAHRREALVNDPAVLEAFLDLLRRGAPAVEALWSMNRHGVLAGILPPFARVVGRMQYDLFHVYTVDEHTLRVLRNVAWFDKPEARREFPVACEVFANLDKPELLLLGALFHDIAKGRGGDHSTLGEDDARRFCARLGLDDDDTELVAWLVRWHLLLSTTAQRQDITDPAVVHDFAARVGDWERLDNLYLLTIADIRGTSPKLWNAWKARLLADLYVAARYALRSDLAPPLRADARVRACRDRARKLLLAEGLDQEAIEAVWADFPDASFLRHRAEQIAWQTRAMLKHEDPPLVAVHPLSVRGTTELFVCAPDREGLFAAITAALDRLRFSVVEARILSSNKGLALDTFLLLDSDTMKPARSGRAEALAAELRQVLSRTPYASRPVSRGLSRQLRHFQMTPRTEYVDDPASGRTQLALVCTDRPGLLAAVAQAFADTGIKVHDARIATFGERVEDFFQLTDGHDRLLDAQLRQQLDEALQQRVDTGSDDD
ncbi:MAG: [protein-PII] uridylyltransferase [Rhodanobacteraceae bacterium]